MIFPGLLPNVLSSQNCTCCHQPVGCGPTPCASNGCVEDVKLYDPDRDPYQVFPERQMADRFIEMNRDAQIAAWAS